MKKILLKLKSFGECLRLQELKLKEKHKFIYTILYVVLYLLCTWLFAAIFTFCYYKLSLENYPPHYIVFALTFFFLILSPLNMETQHHIDELHERIRILEKENYYQQKDIEHLYELETLLQKSKNSQHPKI